MNRHIPVLLSLVLAVCLVASMTPAIAEETLTHDQAKTLTDRYVEARNTGNLALLDDYFTPDVITHDSGKEFSTLDELKAFYTRNHTAFPDLKFTFDRVLVSGEYMTVVFTMSGTNTGPMEQMPPTGRPVRLTGVALDRVANGKVAESWVYYNPLDILIPLGFTLTPPAPEKQ